MAASLTDILSAIQNGVQAVNAVASKLSTVFPQATTSSTGAPSAVGAITYASSQATGFLLVALSSGTTVKIPYYTQ